MSRWTHRSPARPLSRREHEAAFAALAEQCDEQAAAVDALRAERAALAAELAEMERRRAAAGPEAGPPPPPVLIGHAASLAPY